MHDIILFESGGSDAVEIQKRFQADDVACLELLIHVVDNIADIGRTFKIQSVRMAVEGMFAGKGVCIPSEFLDEPVSEISS